MACRVVFLHPDLGLGGAERLVVDAAVALQRLGCVVDVVTAHFDPNRCFPETLNELKEHVHVGGDGIPRQVRGKFHLVFSIVRTAAAAIKHAKLLARADVVIADQVAYVIPVVQMLCGWKIPVVFYCHFPDYLLAPVPTSILQRVYRYPLDTMEQWTTGMANAVIVNSKFTASVFRESFPRLSRVDLDILYPPCDVGTFSHITVKPQYSTSMFKTRSNQTELLRAVNEGVFLLSLNRFERKKGLDLAVRAIALLAEPVMLILAGGHDIRVTENVEHLQELQKLAITLGVSHRVLFVPSCTQEEKICLLTSTRCLLYTPQREHFGIVPLEAGAASRPVIACNSGGPLETILSGATGFLVDPTPQAFAKASQTFLSSDGETKSREFGERGRRHVEQHFSPRVFGEKLLEICTHVKKESSSAEGISWTKCLLLSLFFHVLAIIVFVVGYRVLGEYTEKILILD